MWRYYVLCGGQIVYRTDDPRDAHREARRHAREKQMIVLVTRSVCKWEMQPIRRNAR